MTAAALDPAPWLFRLEAVARDVDGDTVYLRVERDVDAGFREAMRISTVREFRLAVGLRSGIDTPEPKGVTRAMGLAASARTLTLLGNLVADWPLERRVVASFGEDDKYGRWLADMQALTAEGAIDWTVARQLLLEGYALPYDGKGPRPHWTPGLYPLPPELRRGPMGS